MIVAKFFGTCAATAHGLTQWDYGQELAVECSSEEIRDGTETHFYQGKLSSLGYLKNRHVLIPDLMLQNAEEILAYVYVRSAESGETVLTIRMPVAKRPRPGNYILPEYREYLRLIPEGGSDGQVLTKRSELDFDTGWEDSSVPEDFHPMTDDEIDALFKEAE